MTLNTLVILTLCAILLLSIHRIIIIIISEIREARFKRQMKYDEQRRTKEELENRFERLGNYIADVRSSVWRLEEELNKKENKKNVKKKKRN